MLCSARARLRCLATAAWIYFRFKTVLHWCLHRLMQRESVVQEPIANHHVIVSLRVFEYIRQVYVQRLLLFVAELGSACLVAECRASCSACELG